MGKREKTVIISAFVLSLLVIILGVLSSFYLEKQDFSSFNSITGNVIVSCSNSFYPICEGDCSEDMSCLPDPQSGNCICSPKSNSYTSCSDSEYPICYGECPLSLECKPNNSSGECECVSLEISGDLLKKHLSACYPDFECTEWSSCIKGEQFRVCVDINECAPRRDEVKKCGNETGIGNETNSSIEVVCTPNWKCSSWGECQNNTQIRVCYDMNECNTDEYKPEEVKECLVAPTAAATIDEENFDKKESILTPFLKIGLILLGLIIFTVILIIYLVIKKPKTANKTVAVGISLFIILNISGLVYFSYQDDSQIQTTANVVAINKIVPAIKNEGITDNMFVEIFNKMSPLKKASIVNILVIISTLILIMALVLNKKR